MSSEPGQVFGVAAAETALMSHLKVSWCLWRSLTSFSCFDEIIYECFLEARDVTCSFLRANQSEN